MAIFSLVWENLKGLREKLKITKYEPQCFLYLFLQQAPPAFESIFCINCYNYEETKEKAVATCKECQSNICLDCIEAHSIGVIKGKSMKSHHITWLESVRILKIRLHPNIRLRVGLYSLLGMYLHICKGWVATVYWVARMHVTRPDGGAHMFAHLQYKVLALCTCTNCKLTFFHQFLVIQAALQHRPQHFSLWALP